jgi:hypothetical protein
MPASAVKQRSTGPVATGGTGMPIRMQGPKWAQHFPPSTPTTLFPTYIISIFGSRSRWSGNILLEPEPKFLGLAPAPGM